jgi:hypothetical protein
VVTGHDVVHLHGMDGAPPGAVRCYRRVFPKVGCFVLKQRGSQRATLVEHVIELPSLVDRFLRCPTCGLGG